MVIFKDQLQKTDEWLRPAQVAVRTRSEKDVNKLKGFQKKYLRGLAHSLNPVVFVGQKGMTEALEKSVNEALDTHELIKVKFIDFKEKEQKLKISALIEAETGCEMVGMIGHVAIFYRIHRDEKKRKIIIPVK